MSDHEKRRDDNAPPPDDLTRLLRDADPAAGTPPLDPVELAHIRAAVTAAAGERPAHPRAWLLPLGWAVPALAATATGVVALGLWLAFGPPAAAPPSNVAAIDTTPSTATSETPAGAPAEAPSGSTEQMPTPPLPEVAAVDPTTPEAAVAVPAPDPTTMVATTETPTPAATDPPVAGDEPAPGARTLQFTAPRGTRIIWTLDPDFESPISGQDARQEESK